MDQPQRLSGPFALASGLLMVLFTAYGFWIVIQARTPALCLVLVWALIASAMLSIWGRQAQRKYKVAFMNHYCNPSSPKPEGGIGHPTLEMVGGVSAAVIASVTLALLFASGEKNAKDQLRVACAQLRADHPPIADALPPCKD